MDLGQTRSKNIHVIENIQRNLLTSHWASGASSLSGWGDIVSAGMLATADRIHKNVSHTSHDVIWFLPQPSAHPGVKLTCVDLISPMLISPSEVLFDLFVDIKVLVHTVKHWQRSGLPSCSSMTPHYDKPSLEDKVNCQGCVTISTRWRQVMPNLTVTVERTRVYVLCSRTNRGVSQ